MIATGTAIAIAAAASAGSSVAAAKIGSNAAKNAAKTQAQSAREAQGMAGNIFQQQQQQQSPYMALGSNSAMTLGRLMGQPQGSRFAAPPMNLGQFGGPPQVPSGVAPLAPPQGSMGPPPMGPPSGYTGGPPMGQPPMQRPFQRNNPHLSQFGPPQQGGY